MVVMTALVFLTFGVLVYFEYVASSSVTLLEYSIFQRLVEALREPVLTNSSLLFRFFFNRLSILNDGAYATAY